MCAASDTYIPIKLASISSNSILGFDLYNESGGNYQLYRRKDVTIEQEDLHTLMERGCHTLYVPESQSDLLAEYQISHLAEMLNDDTVPVERKSEMLIDISSALYAKFFENPLPPTVVRNTVTQCANHVELARQGETARDCMMPQKREQGSPADHAIAVCNLSILLGMQSGIKSAKALHAVGVSGMLHEVGKVLINPEPSPPTEKVDHEAEMKLKGYPELGAQLLADDEAVPELALRSVREHQERLDGSGFPRKLKGKAICVEARIVGLCDAFDEAMNESSGPRRLSAFQILSNMKNAPHRFDERLFRSFVQLLASGVTGRE